MWRSWLQCSCSWSARRMRRRRAALPRPQRVIWLIPRALPRSRSPQGSGRARQTVRPTRIRRAYAVAARARSTRQWRIVCESGKNQRARDAERQRAVHRGDAGRGGWALECPRARRPSRRCRVCGRCDRSSRDAGLLGRYARLCHRILRWRTHDVAGRVPARLAHRGDRTGLRSSISRAVHRSSGSGS